MKSAVINQKTNQLTLDFEPGLVDTYPCLRECVASGIYRRGLGKTAIDLDQAPGNLSVQVSADPSRHFSIDSFESYLEKTKDFTPIYYLIEKFLSCRDTKKDAAQAQLLTLMAQLQPLMKQAGLT